ncbi:hypothetical protein Vadar_001390 [Vaccinium darrowii]|uniref:Uncharacterized protein n=1 Tax=Vaccinium darrowii TaxID=229202 RepID=A0ACB7XVW2_9ERIC|nr:hypothetical protein Vadar_001390 [Vaccinium darrowii]
MFPVLAMGHLIPLCEFAKRLVLAHNFSVTFIVPNDGPLSTAPKLFLDSLIPVGINYVLLPSVNVDELSNDVVSAGSRISLAASHSLPSLHDVLKSLVSSSRVVALVVDLMATDAFDVTAEFNLSPYAFFASTAMLLSFILDIPKLDESVSCEHRKLLEPVKIPGGTLVHGKDILLDLVQDRKSDSYKRLLNYGKRYRLVEGIMVNSFKELEGGDVKALQEEEPGKPPVYPIGPLIRMGGVDNGSDCLRWLDDQPYGSVFPTLVVLRVKRYSSSLWNIQI